MESASTLTFIVNQLCVERLRSPLCLFHVHDDDGGFLESLPGILTTQGKKAERCHCSNQSAVGIIANGFPLASAENRGLSHSQRNNSPIDSDHDLVFTLWFLDLSLISLVR
jgi:hypothetical protein